MPVIARHHLLRGDGHAPSEAWPEDCYVQWGGSGVVISEDAVRSTAFFEAFPKEGGFIRGEGATIAEAEAEAIGKYEKASACDHLWARGRHLNGGTTCRRCGHFMTTMRPVVTLGDWSKPPSASDLLKFIEGTVIMPPHDDESRRRDSRSLLRARAAGYEIPDIPEGEEVNPFDKGTHPYVASCRDAIFSKLGEAPNPDEAAGAINALFSRMSLSSLEGYRKEWEREKAGA